MGTGLPVLSKSKYLDGIPLHLFRDKRYNTLVLSVLSNLLKGQVTRKTEDSLAQWTRGSEKATVYLHYCQNKTFSACSGRYG